MVNGDNVKQWVRRSWNNMLIYCIHNNPQGWRDWIDQNTDVANTTELDESAMINMVRDLAISSGKPEQFMFKLASAIPHNDAQSSWANVKTK
jgi:hypothetical protein